ncbi:CBS domain-containing protein [Tetragenococcus koreensis]|uniref:CBS domain protein n=1 Tax=Tetragenococcus koreensis TaxID=290335 RepID=A0AAN4UCC6_9ENTE|nr:CBS domain-containing protein [Tetragenococcus koreensis]MCF1584761.1 CBS domain-containing protein [Tetragenococcus koreensis]MCF1614377.1 CBS domain-containing protein [Tetragenococcus koreensis]MCF1617676.1 CBS domain-containing protein [Tetragenococcus koreensis]MCF1620043.1 CBS domain-containing protein [Tetragenococcus koreensis]MCF1622464.1 CBS domain-containing protein [Tetragenococcus koreensis]
MAVRDFMTKNLITVTPQDPIFDAVDLMKEHDIHRLPVLKNDQLVGLITEGTIQAAMPSSATSLSIHETNFLLNKTTVQDVMVKKVATIAPDALLEEAISLMRAKKIGVLPVVKDEQLQGIITNNDIFDAFLKITGYNSGGTRVTIQITKDHKGILATIAQTLADADFSISTLVVDRQTDKTIIEAQIDSQATEQISQILNDAGYTVISCVLTNA